MTGYKPIARVVLVDGHETYRRYLHDFLEKRLQLHVVGEADDGEAALRIVEELVPDAVLVDVATPRVGGLMLTRRIAAEHPDVKVIALSLYGDREFERAVFEAGASGFLTKDEAVDRLPRALRTVAAGHVYRGR